MKKRRIPLFWSTIIWLAIAYLFLRIGIPWLSMIITGKDRLLPIPGVLMVMFMGLALIGALVQVSISDENLKEFLKPVVELLRGEKGGTQRILRSIVLVAFPLLIGWIVYSQSVVKVRSPIALRIQHPTIPSKYENLENPFREADIQTQKRYIEEGRILYQKNCRPCHGTKVDGNGPMARGFRLKPSNFMDPGTIATVVESYSFWRIKEGAWGLPPEASPWDSSMPSWKDELTDDEIWKIIMAEYDTAGVEPRKLEKIE